MKYLAFYFPQFYPIPENDEWWGAGFTDWRLVRGAKPHSPGQRQPRTPLNGDYYDQSLRHVVEQQARLATHYGLYGFNFYHYWFDGRLVLGKPVEHFRSSDKHNLRYCFTWANESWTRQWQGSSDVLIRQRHMPDEDIWRQHFDYLVEHFEDSRYIKVDGKPVFCIYRPELDGHLGSYVAFMDSLARQRGLAGIYFVGMQSYPFAHEEKIYSLMNASVKFQPRYLFNTALSPDSLLRKRFESFLRSLPESCQIVLGKWKSRFSSPRVYDYDLFYEKLLEAAEKDGPGVFQSAIVDWDNTARYSRRSRLFAGANPVRFEYWLDQLSRLEAAKGNDFIFINAWNEWSESAYLEPDTHFGNGYLDAIRTLSARYGN